MFFMMILTTTQQIEGHTIREYKAPIEREKSDARINSSEREEAYISCTQTMWGVVGIFVIPVMRSNQTSAVCISVNS